MRLIIPVFTYTNKNRIVLVVESLSGSNTFALSKLFDEKISSRYYIDVLFDGPVNGVKEYFIKYRRLTKAKYIFTTHASYKPSIWHVHFQLWHGAFVKKNGILLTPINKKVTTKQTAWERANYVLSYSETYTTYMNACMGLNPNKYFVSGAPRNDFLFLSQGLQNLETLTGIDLAQKKILFYLPTFRENVGQDSTDKNSYDIFSLNGNDLMDFWDFIRRNDIFIVVKGHPHLADTYNNFDTISNVFFLTDNLLLKYNIDLYEVLNCAHLLITDFSSVFYDFLLMDRPMLFVFEGINSYKKSRGFLIESLENYMPGPIVNTYENLTLELQLLLSDKNYYAKERYYLKRHMHRYHDGKATDRISDFILNIAK